MVMVPVSKPEYEFCRPWIICIFEGRYGVINLGVKGGQIQ